MFVNLGAALTDAPGRRGEGRAMLRRVVDLAESAGDSVLQCRAINNLLCEVVYTHDDDALALIDRLETIVFGGGLGAQFGEQIALFRGLLAERDGNQQAALDALGWLGRAGPPARAVYAIFAAGIDAGGGHDRVCAPAARHHQRTYGRSRWAHAGCMDANSRSHVATPRG